MGGAASIDGAGCGGSETTSRITMLFAPGSAGLGAYAFVAADLAGGGAGGCGSAGVASAGAGSGIANHGVAVDRAFAYNSGPKRKIANPTRATPTIIGTPMFLKLRGINPCALPNISIAANKKTAPIS